MRPTKTFLLLLASVAAAPSAVAQDSYTGVERIVAVGDVHGDFHQFAAVLRTAGVIDDDNKWVGGKTHLVQTGDILDRGPESRKVMDLLMVLEEQAERAGGKVHALIGNHEAMNVLGDLRYVSAAEYDAFRTSRAKVLRERAYKALADSTLRDDEAYRRRWEEDHPLGWVEHRLAFEGNGKYGTWLRAKNAVVRIDGFLFLHGGISPKYLHHGLADLNQQVRQDLDTEAMSTGIAEDSLGPLWYRGLATGAEAPLAAHVDSVLAAYGVRHIVIGHTPTVGAVVPRYAGKVILIDVGLSAYYGGAPSCLVIERGVPSALHRGELVALPLDGSLITYLQAVAALEPPATRLRTYVEQLAGAPIPSRSP